MKKITLMFLVVFSCFCMYAQETFEGPWTTQTGAGPGGPAGWAINNVAGPIQTWIQGNGSGTQPAYQGTHSAFMNNENVAPGTQTEDWLIMPLTTVPTNGQLRFWSRLLVPGDQETDYFIRISTVANTPADQWNTANYEATPLAQWTELEINPSQLEWAEKIVSLSGYVGQQVYIAFVMKGDQGDRWAIDNVNVVSQCLDPTNLGANGFGLTTANLTWTGAAGATSFDIEIMPQATAPTGVPDTTVTGTSYGATAADGLSEGSDYKFYVRANCGSGNYSNWVGPFNFSTVALGDTCAAPIEVDQLPYSVTDNTSNYADTNYEGSPGATGCGVTNNYLDGNNVIYAYEATQTGIISLELSGITDTYAGMFVYNSCANIGVSCVGGAFNNWETTNLNIPTLAVTAGTTYYIMISSWPYPQTIGYTLTIQEVHCDPPVGLPVTSIGMTSVNLSWTNPSGATSWEYVVQPVADGIPSGSGTTATNNTDWPVSDLTASTAYEYYVRADCGDGSFSAWAGPYPFNTAGCELADQCTYTIVMTSDGSGWDGAVMTLSQNGIALAVVGPEFTWEDGEGPVTVTVPVCDGVPIDLFWNTGGFSPGNVGVSLQNNFGQTFYTKPFDTGLPNTLLYTGTLDCEEVLCLPPDNLSVSNITTTSAQLGWNGAEDGSYVYYVVEAGGDAPEETDGVPVNTNTPVVNSLEIATNYEYYVRMECDGGELSPWAGPFAFSTKVCEDEFQCDYTFVMTSDWWIGYDDATMVISQNGTTVATIGDTFTTGESQTITVPLCTNTPFEVYWEDGGDSYYQVGLKIINGFDQVLYELLPYEGEPGTMLFEGDADCEHPACIMPVELYKTEFTTTTATVGWQGAATGNWEYFVVEAGGDAPDDTATPTGTATTNPFTVPGLDPATNYDFYVRIVCADGGGSEWGGPLAINTAVCEEEFQCNYVFRLTDEWGGGWSGGASMTVYQAGVPVAVLGPEFTFGESMDVEVGMCPGEEFQLVWTNGGWNESSMGVIIFTPFEDIYTKDAGEGSVGDILYESTASCTAPLCPKPQQLGVSNIELTEVDFSFTEMGDATQWEVLVLPYGSDDPLVDDPVNTANIITGTGSDITTVLDDLESATSYLVFVRALCGGDDGNSLWSGPVSFTTAIVNDDCDAAINIPVNPGAQCIENVSGTVTGATPSGIASSCSWEAPEYEVWYTFEAAQESHAIQVSNQVNGYFSFAVFEGSCDGLEEVFCQYSSSDIVDGLTPGTTYYVQVYTDYLSSNDPTSFDVCITTPEPPVTVSEDQYTPEELITEVFLGSDCAYVSNVVAITGYNNQNGDTFITDNGIGYWQSNGSSFQFQSLEDPTVTFTSGIVLLSGDAEDDVPGPNDPLSISAGWNNDQIEADLEALLATYPEFENDPGLACNGSTSISFDFSPVVDLTSGTTLFQFLFASDEYGTPSFECTFSDVFAFILTDLEDPTQQWNLAVLPNGQLILVTNIHPDNTDQGADCPGINEEYFGTYNGLLSPINFNGQSTLMKAVLPVDLIAGHQYNMQMVIANEGDNSYSSGVFLMEGSFNLGEIDLGEDMLVDDNTAVCDLDEGTISTDLDPDMYDFVWYKNNEVIPGENGTTLYVNESGVYKLEATAEGLDCVRTGTIVVEFYPNVADVTGDPIDLAICDADGFAEFDLTENTDEIVDNATTTQYDYEVAYFLTQADAEGGTATPLPTTYTNTVQYTQTLYAAITNVQTGCTAVKAFDLIVEDNTPQFTISDNFSICDGTSGTITVVPGNFDVADVTISWTQDGAPFAGTGLSITVTEAGVYEVSINNTGCIGTDNTTVTVTPIPVPQEIDDLTVCDSYTLPAPDAGNRYFTQTNGGGTELFAGDVIDSTQEIFVQAESGTTPNCTSESSFTVTVVPSPVIVDAETADIEACDSYVLPALTVGAYYTEAAGAGTEIPAGTEITASQTVYVFASSGTVPCTDEASFTVTITTTPDVAELDDVVMCDLFELPALPAGNTYYTGSGATGQALAAGTQIVDTQTVYIYAVAAANADCTNESSFNVVIIPTPDVLITQGCNDDNLYELGVDFADDIYSEDLVSFSWTNAAGAQVGTGATLILSAVNGQPALGEGTYTLTVTPYGDIACPIDATVDVVSIMCELPRGISPNGDGKNDSFDLTALDVVKLEIFNRYGTEVYSYSGDYTDQFEGVASNGHNLPTGTYFYMVQRSNGETLTGWVYVNWEE